MAVPHVRCILFDRTPDTGCASNFHSQVPIRNCINEMELVFFYVFFSVWENSIEINVGSEFTQAMYRIWPANPCIPMTFCSSPNVLPIKWPLPQSFQKTKKKKIALEMKKKKKNRIKIAVKNILTIFPIDCHDKYCSQQHLPSEHAGKNRKRKRVSG